MVVHSRNNDGEFVAAEPGHDLLIRHDRVEPLRDTDQQAVADAMADGVVHHLEAIHVHEQDRKIAVVLRVAQALQLGAEKMRRLCRPVRGSSEASLAIEASARGAS